MIILGADHAGYQLKEEIKNYLIEQNEDIVDVGAFKLDNEDNFSTFVRLIKKAFMSNTEAKIIACCGSGVGMNIGINKIKGVFSCLGHSVEEVKKAREHNNINALTLGGRTTDFDLAKKMVEVFLNTENLGGKYIKRMEEIDN